MSGFDTTYRFIPLALVLAAGAANAQMPDAEIRRAVITEFAANDAVSAHKIDVTVDDGVVSLDGEVSSLLDEREAVRIAQAVRGVTAVEEEIEIDPPKIGDGELRRDVEQALVMDPATESYELDVAVEDGYVILDGIVDSWHERQLAERVAAGVRGVTGVNIGGVEVDVDAERPAHEIRGEVRGRLEADIYLEDRLIDVEVDDGVVELSGTVGSLAEKHRAVSDAWVAGTERVDAENLEVNAWLDEEALEDAGEPTITDSWIAAAIQTELVYNPRIDSTNVSVEVNDRKVTLSGTVKNLRAFDTAAEIARTTTGVDRVYNLLAVRTDRADPDSRLENRIERLFEGDPHLSDEGITISVNDGVVTLRGEVDTTFLSDRAETMAGNMEGVYVVLNRLDAETEWTWRPDSELVEDVRDQLFWSPYVDSDDIRVTVENSVVTLTGTVDSSTELIEARQNALEADPKDLRVRLDVEP